MTTSREALSHRPVETGAARDDLRAYLAELEAKGKLHRVNREVDTDWELACSARRMYRAVPEPERCATLFEHVKGFSIPVVCGAVGASRQVYALAMGVPEEQMYDHWAWAIANPVQPVFGRTSGALRL